MNLTDLHTLVDYNYWARDRLLAAVEALTPEQFTRDLGSSFRSVRDTLVHIMGAEFAWLSRWKGESPTSLWSADQFADLASVGANWGEVEKGLRGFVAELKEEDIGRVFHYKLLSGTAGASPFWQMLQHVVNHGSYHRGQCRSNYLRRTVESHTEGVWSSLGSTTYRGNKLERHQVVTMLRQLGAAPPKSVDLIAFYREKP